MLLSYLLLQNHSRFKNIWYFLGLNCFLYLKCFAICFSSSFSSYYKYSTQRAEIHYHDPQYCFQSSLCTRQRCQGVGGPFPGRRSTRSPCSHLLLLSYTSNKSLSPPQTWFSHIQGVLQLSPPPSPPSPPLSLSHSTAQRLSALHLFVAAQRVWGYLYLNLPDNVSGARVPFHARVVRIPAVLLGDRLARTELGGQKVSEGLP